MKKVFPVSLDKLFQINAELLNYTGSRDAPKRCRTCTNAEARLSKCGGCGLYSYCNKVKSELNCLCSCRSRVIELTRGM